ncbi:hypothetical protein Bca52824_019330 [Brassica carinata]|uniref:Uncharacterized protein n=1 Tax=Brassica carinata TaxID=52824 RepID=A0A8X8AZK2_BRACI|nr:hypothetical protein Bca52824_019330 [Brassica carinata]
MEQVMNELREATYQYTNVPDPIESAARRQRMLDGEIHGLMKKNSCQHHSICGGSPATISASGGTD